MKIGIVSAFAAETRSLRRHLEEVARSEIDGLLCFALRHQGEEVLVLRSGMGTRQGYQGTRVLIEKFGAQVIINCGAAGAVSPQRRIGDVVVSDKVVEYDAGPGSLAVAPAFHGHPALLRMVLEMPKATATSHAILAGTILSGDRTVESRQEKRRLWNDYHGQCVEQEGAGVARICELSGIPWVVIRGISDLADEKAREDFQNNMQQAVDNAAQVAFNLVTRLVGVSNLNDVAEIFGRQPVV